MGVARLLAILAVVLGVAHPAGAQEVRRFIDPTRTRETLKASSPADAEMLSRIPLGSRWQPRNPLSIPTCLWRSPLRSPGGYVDGEANSPAYEFYARVPFPKSRIQMRGLTPVSSQAFAQVAYLDLKGGRNNETGRPTSEFTDIVFPPVRATTGKAPAFTVATVDIGTWSARQVRVRPIVPGLPVRVRIEDPFAEVLAALAQGGTMRVWVGRHAAASDTASPAQSVEGEFPALAGDHGMIMAKLADMMARGGAGQCKVFPDECYDGACG